MSISRHVSDSIQSNKQQAHPDNMSNLHKQLLKPFSVNLGPFGDSPPRFASAVPLVLEVRQPCGLWQAVFTHRLDISHLGRRYNLDIILY